MAKEVSIRPNWTGAVLRARQNSQKISPGQEYTPAQNRLESLSPQEIRRTLEEISQNLKENHLSNGRSVDYLKQTLITILQKYHTNTLNDLIRRTRNYAEKLNIPQNKRPTWMAEKIAIEYERKAKQ